MTEKGGCEYFYVRVYLWVNENTFEKSVLVRVSDNNLYITGLNIDH